MAYKVPVVLDGTRFREVQSGDTLDISVVARMPNDKAITARNAADSADLKIVQMTTSDIVSLGGAGVNAVQLSDGTDGWQMTAQDWIPFNDAVGNIGSATKRPIALWLSGDINEAAGGFRHSVGPYTQDNVAANQTDVALTGTRWIATRAGSVVGVVVKSTEARTAGTCTVTVFKNTGLSGAAGATIGLTAVLDGTNTSVKATTQAKDTDTFAAGDEIFAVVTTDAGWTPTTADIRVWIEVEQ